MRPYLGVLPLVFNALQSDTQVVQLGLGEAEAVDRALERAAVVCNAAPRGPWFEKAINELVLFCNSLQLVCRLAKRAQGMQTKRGQVSWDRSSAKGPACPIQP